MARQQAVKGAKTATRIGAGTYLKGKLRFRDSLRVSGTFEGEIESEGLLYIDENAVVRADVRARSVIIGGTLRGNAHATERVEMLPAAKIYGNVRTSKVYIGEGVVFEGKCEMIKNVNAVDIFAVPANQLRKSVQGVFRADG
ncbi:MAG: polymer-forming cytoskeletal protein [Spirochaetales bacterium]